MIARQQQDGLQPVKSRDTDFIGALTALRRAAAKARRRAFNTTGSVAMVKDGRVVWQKEDGTLLDEPERFKRGVSPRDDRS